MNLKRLLRSLSGLAVVIAGIGAHTLVAAQEGGDGAAGADVDPAAISSPDGANDPAAEGGEERVEDEEQARRLPAPAGIAAKDPFELPPELLNGLTVNALPDPNRSVEQIKAEAEAAVQRALEAERQQNAAGAAR